jgi:hypothetical protein
MTYVYNATLRTMADYIREDFDRVNIEDKLLYTYTDSTDETIGSLEYNDFMSLAKTIKEIVNSEFPKINALSQYLTEIASLMNTLNLPIP